MWIAVLNTITATIWIFLSVVSPDLYSYDLLGWNINLAYLCAFCFGISAGMNWMAIGEQRSRRTKKEKGMFKSFFDGLRRATEGQLRVQEFQGGRREVVEPKKDNWSFDRIMGNEKSVVPEVKGQDDDGGLRRATPDSDDPFDYEDDDDLFK